ncbi:MAG: Hsp20/alpha crystallin family protein [Spirochaetales bacterium]|nr:Hsp20/alpha crystallin family protein [Spirochaetales bacterium]
MKDRIVIDLAQMLDEIFEATHSFGEAFKKGFTFPHRGDGPFQWDENVDFYPHHSYPPANAYITEDRTLIFEFALAGFPESGISLEFQGDHMVLSAKALKDQETTENVRYFKHRLKLKDIEGQKYFVPADKFDRDKVKAVYKNGLLKVTIPSVENVESKEGIRINIVQEDEE